MEQAGTDLAFVVFDHIDGAEQAYSRAPRELDGVSWAQEIALVEHHRHDRLVIRGVVAGHYVDADDELTFIGVKTAEGAVAGAAGGLLLGPMGLAVGIVGGGLAGSIAEEHSGPRLRSALFDEVRSKMPEGSSAVLLLGGPDHVDAMLAALDGLGGSPVRIGLSPELAQALRDAVADSPSAAVPPSV